MSNATPSRLGQQDAAGDPLALFLKVFAGEVLTAFNRDSAFRPRHQVRTIASGKSASFPVTGLASAAYHTPGAEITGGVIRHGEKIITIDDLLVAPAFIANIDEAMNHYDVRSIYSDEIGQALAKAYDTNVARAMIADAARAAANLTGLSGGGNITDAAMNTDGTKLWQGIFNAGVTLDSKDIPQNDRYGFLRPTQYALVVMSEKPINRDLNGPLGSEQGIQGGQVERINNIMLVKTNNLPSADDSANLAIPSNRRHDYSVTQGLVAHKGAAGTVQLQDVTMESAYDIRRQGTLMVGKYLVGHGGLRPEAAIELRTGAPSS
jgi:hypothetical protein